MTSEPLVSDVRIGGKRLEIAPHNCFACGTLNAHGLHLELHASEDVCWVELVLPERFEGWEGIAHGGIVCTLLDEVMAWALVDHDLWGVTARMSVEFRRPVPIGRPVRAEGRVVSVRRRLVEAEGVVLDGTDGTRARPGDGDVRRGARGAQGGAQGALRLPAGRRAPRHARRGGRRRSGAMTTATAPSPVTERARAFVADHTDRAVALGRAAGEQVHDPVALAERPA